MKDFLKMLPAYLLLAIIVLVISFVVNKEIVVFYETRPIEQYTTVIIDAGHGGVDGGASSINGTLESHINLEIATRLNDLMHLIGIRTIMTRQSDESIHTSGNTIAAKKLSDLKERVRIVNTTDNALLISIHQNYYSDPRYKGAQVFYSDHNQSMALADLLQKSFIMNLNPGSRRNIKRADSIYLLNQTVKPAVLIECGFLSNPEENDLLATREYQLNVCCVIASSISSFISNT